MKRRIISIAGAYVAWVMGSGFATGQEILQFFTSYGMKSYLLILINLIGFLIIGTRILTAGQSHQYDKNFDHFEYFCGKRLGRFYHFFLPLSMLAGMIILISGAGTTLQEYYGINHNVGAFFLAFMAFMAYVIGFQRFVKAAACIGPMIIAFTLFVGTVTVLSHPDALPLTSQAAGLLAAKQPVHIWWLAGFLYISYNIYGGSKYYAALGMRAVSAKEARLGAMTGSIALMLVVFLMNTAMMTDVQRIVVLGIPTLYLAGNISYILGAVFSVILLCGIFSSCSAMLWTICETFIPQGSKKGIFVAGAISLSTFLVGLLPFSDLIRVAYTASGYIGLLFIGCTALKCADNPGTPAQNASLTPVHLPKMRR